jgi:hypothetical protein
MLQDHRAYPASDLKPGTCRSSPKYKEAVDRTGDSVPSHGEKNKQSVHAYLLPQTQYAQNGVQKGHFNPEEEALLED